MNGLAKVEEIMEDTGVYYEYIGLRTQDTPFELGSLDHTSSVWIDGTETDELLDGVCVTDLQSQHTPSYLSKMVYYGKYTAIIGGNRATRGEDLGELIISDPVVLVILND